MRFRRWLALLLLWGGLMGCTSRVMPQEAQIVILWHTFRGAEAAALQTLTDQFNAEQQGKIVLVTEYQRNILTKLTAAPASSRPDLVVVWPEDASAYIDAGLTVPWSAWPDALHADQLDLLPMGAALYTVRGEIQALPLGLATYVLYYNADWLSDLGFTASRATWTELQGAACAATDPAGGQVGLGLPAEPAVLLALLTSAGAQITDAAGLYQFADASGLTLAGNLNEILGGLCAYIYDDSTEGAARLSSSSLAMIVESSLNWPSVEKKVLEGRNFNLALSAASGTAGPGRTLWYGPGLMLIAPEGGRRAAAAEVLTWFFSVEAQDAWNGATGYLPARRTLIEDYLAGAPETARVETQLWQLALDAADTGAWVAWPRYTNKMACRASLLRALLSLGGRPTPGAYIEAAATACNTGVK